jgi:hypothetical protein
VWPFEFQWAQYQTIHINATVHDVAEAKAYSDHKRFAVKLLDPVSYIASNPAHGHQIVTLQNNDEAVGELLAWAVDEYSATRRLLWDRVVQVCVRACMCVRASAYV